MAEGTRTLSASTDRPASSVSRVRAGYESDRGVGWMIFAGTMIGIVGGLNIIYGIAAISDSKFFFRDVEYILSSLNTWGWFMLVVGVVQVCAAVGIWAWAQWARWVGILSAGVNSILQLLVIPAHPWLALTLFAVDVLVIYGLVVYGGRRFGAV